jgi:deoxyribonuclease-4
MPHFGAHVSVAGGYARAVTAAGDLGMTAVQLFVSSPRMWPVRAKGDGWEGKPLDAAAVTSFQAARRERGVERAVAHASYLINLATPAAEAHRRSVAALVLELTRAEQLGLEGLVVHPGSPGDAGAEAGIAQVVAGVDEVHRRCPGFRARVLLETTAGQGKTLGHRFEELAAVLKAVKDPDRLGFCVDTCHVFAAGYALAPAKAYRATLRQWDDLIGVERIQAFHVNDSQKPLGSRVDRHAHVGQGCLGLEPFRLLVRDRRFKDVPMLLETPKGVVAGEAWDAVNLATLRELAKPPRRG